MVLVDTSVWIRILADKSPYAAELSGLLNREQVVGHELVFGELLIGDKGGRKALLSEYSHIPWLPMIPHPELVGFVYSRRLHGRGAGWIEIHLLASALVSHVKFWTADHTLSLLAEGLGIAYLPPRTHRMPRLR
jgi:predicted nucleic acid-binding protein